MTICETATSTPTIGSTTTSAWRNPPLRQNDFGGTFGGPVDIPGLYHGKDRAFFFVSYEGLRLIAPQPAAHYDVPDAALRANTPAPLNQVLNAFPVQSPNGIDDTVNGIAQFIGSWSNPASLNSTSVRFDDVLNDKLRFFFRFSDTGSSSATRAPGGFSPTMDETAAYTMRTYTAGVTGILSSHLSNDLRLNYTSNETTNVWAIDAFGGGTPVNLAQLAGLGPGASASVGLIYGGYNRVSLEQQKVTGAQRQWNLVETASLSRGHHQIKFGVDFRRLTPFATQQNPNLVYYYFSEASVEANSTTLTVAQATAPIYPLYNNFSVFAQDEWKVSRRFNLSFGLRWDANPAPGVTEGLMPYTIQGTNSSNWALAPQGTPLWQTTWFNFAPRLGAAYVLRSTRGKETVVRGGGGVFYDTGQQFGSYSFNGPGSDAYVFLFGLPFPGGAAGQVPPIVNPPAGLQNADYGFNAHLQLPYTLQWNASIEQAFGSSQALTVSYVGSHASRLLRQNDISTPSSPNATEFIFFENGLTSDYDALQVQFRRRLTRGMTALGSYTWAHCLDYGSNNFSFGYQRGNCDFDIRNNLSVAFSYDLPNVGHSGLVNTVLHHWGVDDRFTARTSFPVTLNGNQLLQPNGQFYNAGLSLVPGQPGYLYGTNCASILQGLGDLNPGQECPGGKAINPNAFVNVNSGLGDAPRNFARGFDAVQMDLAVRREFPIYEKLKLQFRAETFNIFNHPNFGTINSDLCSGPGCTFGQATATLASSLGVLSPLYQQGGPRSMQFALKLIF